MDYTAVHSKPQYTSSFVYILLLSLYTIINEENDLQKLIVAQLVRKSSLSSTLWTFLPVFLRASYHIFIWTILFQPTHLHLTYFSSMPRTTFHPTFLHLRQRFLSGLFISILNSIFPRAYLPFASRSSDPPSVGHPINIKRTVQIMMHFITWLYTFSSYCS
jgi:hypothetical protein